MACILSILTETTTLPFSVSWGERGFLYLCLVQFTPCHQHVCHTVQSPTLRLADTICLSCSSSSPLFLPPSLDEEKDKEKVRVCFHHVQHCSIRLGAPRQILYAALYVVVPSFCNCNMQTNKECLSVVTINRLSSIKTTRKPLSSTIGSAAITGPYRQRSRDFLLFAHI